MGQKVAQIGIAIAGGTIIGPGCLTVRANGIVVSVLGDEVTSHGTYEHAAPTMVESSLTVRAGGIGIVRATDAASCSHTVTAVSCSTNVRAG